MTAQDRTNLIDMVKSSPDDMSLQEFAEELSILALSMEGLEQCKRGEAIPEAEAMKRLERWLK